MNKMTKMKNLCYIVSITLAIFLGRSAAAQSVWTDADLNGLWDDPNNWSGGAPTNTAGWIVTINPAAGPACTIIDTDVIDVGTLSDDAAPTAPFMALSSGPI